MTRQPHMLITFSTIAQKPVMLSYGYFSYSVANTCFPDAATEGHEKFDR